MPADRLVLFGENEGVGHITLNRPETMNALNGELIEELVDVVTICEREPSIRAVLLDGAGPHFCGGGDVKFFVTAGDRLPALARELADRFHTAVARLTRLDKPVVGAAQGAIAGGGLSLLCACDLVV